MKTLEEVIELQRQILDIAGLPNDDQTTTAGMTLHYLQEYRNGKKSLDHEIERFKDTVRNYEETIDQYRMWRKKLEAEYETISREKRKALSWKELSEKQGKPVWFNGIGEYWGAVVETACAERENKPRITVFFWEKNCYDVIYKEDYGKIWKAYRREKGV